MRTGRFLVHGSHDRDKVGASDVGIEIEAGLAFGTGHHGTTRGCLLHFDRLLKRRRPRALLDLGCGAGVLAIAAAKALKRKVWLGDIDPVAVAVANANARLNGVGQASKAVVSRGVENRSLREGAPYDVLFANILAKPLRLLASSLAAVIASDGEAIVSGLLLPDVPGVLASWRAQGFFSPTGSTSRAGRACDCADEEAMPDLPLVIEPETPDDADDIGRLSERVFGPGRFARTAYRIREKADPDPSLSFVARVGTLLVGANAMTPVAIGGTPALLLGPLIVEPVFRSQGIGEALVKRSLEAAKAAGWKLAILVGDEPYYARMGFQPVPPGQITLPGPVDPARLLCCELQPGALNSAHGEARGA